MFECNEGCFDIESTTKYDDIDEDDDDDVNGDDDGDNNNNDFNKLLQEPTICNNLHRPNDHLKSDVKISKDLFLCWKIIKNAMIILDFWSPNTLQSMLTTRSSGIKTATQGQFKEKKSKAKQCSKAAHNSTN